MKTLSLGVAIDGDYLYIEAGNHLARELFVLADYEYPSEYIEGKWGSAKYWDAWPFEATTHPIDSDEPIRVHRDVARKVLAYREGEAWCAHLNDAVMVGSHDPFGFNALAILHWSAVILAHTGESWRELWAWLHKEEQE